MTSLALFALALLLLLGREVLCALAAHKTGTAGGLFTAAQATKYCGLAALGAALVFLLPFAA